MSVGHSHLKQEVNLLLYLTRLLARSRFVFMVVFWRLFLRSVSLTGTNPHFYSPTVSSG